MSNYKIYAANDNHVCDYGLDFFNGVAFTISDAVATWAKSHSYYVEKVSGTALTTVDKLSKDILKDICTDKGVTLPASGMNKREYSLVVAAILGATFSSTTFTTSITVTYAKSAANESGSVPTDSSTGVGTEITVKAPSSLTAPTGKTFSHWVDGAGNTFVANDKLRLGVAALTLTAVWE